MKKNFLTEADKREAELDAKLEKLAASGNWDKAMAELDRFDANNERRHKTHRDDMDLTLLDRKAKDGEYFCGNRLLKLCKANDWIDIIFSQNQEDLHHLVEDEAISAALRELTPCRRKCCWITSSTAFRQRIWRRRWGVRPGTSPSTDRRLWMRLADP